MLLTLSVYNGQNEDSTLYMSYTDRSVQSTFTSIFHCTSWFIGGSIVGHHNSYMYINIYIYTYVYTYIARIN